MNKPALHTLLTLILSCSVFAVKADQLRGIPIDFVNIDQQALFSSLAYLDENDIRKQAMPANYSLSYYHNIDDIQVSFYLATDDISSTHVIGVRGTSNTENAMVDIALKLTLDKTTGIYLHRGFAYAANQTFSELKSILKPGYAIRTTGHSLGGAIALILAAILDSNGYHVSQVVTFGQPKVTNIAGAEKLQSLDIIRVVTAKDLVPLIPLFDPLDINNIDIYWHAGKEIILLEDNRYAVLQGINSMLRATRFTQQPLSDKNLQHHQMQLYRQMLKKKLESAEQIPYETSFNLFNLLSNE